MYSLGKYLFQISAENYCINKDLQPYTPFILNAGEASSTLEPYLELGQIAFFVRVQKDLGIKFGLLVSLYLVHFLNPL